MVFRKCRSPSERRAAGRLLAERGCPLGERGVAGTDLCGLWDVTAPAGQALAGAAAAGPLGDGGVVQLRGIAVAAGAVRRGWAGGWSARWPTAGGRWARPAWWPGRPAGPVSRWRCCAAPASSWRVPAAPPLELARPGPACLRTTRAAGGSWSCEDARGPASARRGCILWYEPCWPVICGLRASVGPAGWRNLGGQQACNPMRRPRCCSSGCWDRSRPRTGSSGSSWDAPSSVPCSRCCWSTPTRWYRWIG